MSNNNVVNSPMLPNDTYFPTSLYPPIPLARPLPVFGKSFRVELSSGLTLNPDTVLRAAIGKSLQTLLREEGLLQPLKQLRYGLLGLHQPSSTTKPTIRSVMGPAGEKFVAVLDGAPIPEELEKMSDWSTLAMTWDVMSPENAMHVAVKSYIELDKFAAQISAFTADNGREAGEQMFQARFGELLPTWRELCPHLLLVGCVRIETSLQVIADIEAMPRAASVEVNAGSLVADFLDPTRRPIGHWLRQVAEKMKCSNNKELADLLVRRGILRPDGRAITHQTLKDWSAMKPGLVMSLDGCQALLQVVADKEAAQVLLFRFALARFLAFLCDFLRACVSTEAPPWEEAQRVLLIRFKQIIASRQQALACG